MFWNKNHLHRHFKKITWKYTQMFPSSLGAFIYGSYFLLFVFSKCSAMIKYYFVIRKIF